MIRIIKDKCNGCGLCVETCPYNAIKVEKLGAKLLYPHIILENCTICGACVDGCDKGAIEIISESQPITHKSQPGYKGVWVFGELSGGHDKSGLHPVVYELVTKGREIADKLSEKLAVVILGDREMEVKIETLEEYGVDEVYLVNDERLANFNVEPYTNIITKLVMRYKPMIFLGGGTSIGRTLFPRIAARLHTGLTADCTELDVEDGLLVQTRPAFGGNIMATILCKNRRPQMATVRPKVLKSKVKDRKSKVKIVKEEFPEVEFASRTRVVKFIEDVTQKVNLEGADIIVAGGMGLRAPENFKLIEQLADAVGGAVGSSRPPVDQGWIAYSHQIGQTGKTVRPRVYIACGISGAIQHIAGMSSSEHIIAINKDPNAPIFKIADIGIVGDLFEVLPKLIARVKACK